MNKRLYQKAIPSSDPRSPKPITFTPQSEPREEEGQYGTQYLYDGTYQGEQQTLYAGKALHRAIQEANPTPGTPLSILRTGEGKDTRWSVVQEGDVREGDEYGPDVPIATRDEAIEQQRAGRNKYLENVKRYGVAWDHAKGFLEKKGDTADINAVAFTFFKMAQDARCDLLVLEEDRGKG